MYSESLNIEQAAFYKNILDNSLGAEYVRKFDNIYRKTPELENIFSKVACLQLY